MEEVNSKKVANRRGPSTIIERPPANTTAVVRGKKNTTGNALVEVYFIANS